MHKFATLALVAALGIAGIGYAKPAEARVYIGVGIGLPGVAVVAPPVVAYAPPRGVWAVLLRPSLLLPLLPPRLRALRIRLFTATATATCTAAIGAKGGPCWR